MPSLQRIESQVAALPKSEHRQFRSWFDEIKLKLIERRNQNKNPNKVKP